ncbi:hypothetical protein Kpol_543p1 [Vanderwaltozyma polyspora DSM 70294]|uniref:Uncharacterized protein n=1 Tax=Vanderwaltozyma polyspora (strain ATCC 22028 / DSM 70294 / BCRC 21397 / CBS 2163 / NBRC 10782 / NRRL Y-8283 / UCD 57-17) TaxID=436907 RepID=A7THK6_VANPO|nr:uncharacterized protein Kpol_543p1 [Vanderwaltozyma polyspora DSM 70294]EDO18172.1 hypothetical protein Kpol_543p1 [Vanderwaltozyma polyspora DSM 70294]
MEIQPLYESITEFVQEKAKTYKQQSIESLDGEIPQSIINLLRQELQEIHSKQLSKSKLDHLSKQVYDIEFQWKKDQVKNIIELIGDVPKYSLGSEIINNDLDNSGGVSLEKLMEDVLKLPKMAIADDENNTENEAMILTEYNNLKDELTKKSKIIQYGENELKVMKVELKELENLFKSIREFSNVSNNESDDHDVTGYMKSYNEKLESSLKEMQYLLEESIKTSTNSPERRKQLQELLEEIS